MPNLSDNELQALAYYGIGVGTEGGDTAYQLSFCGNSPQAGVLQPIGNSGYSIGEMQIDLGAKPALAVKLVDKFEEWASANHPDWMLKDKKEPFASDLARNGDHIRDPNYDVDYAKYKHDHHGQPLPRGQLPNTGRDIDQTFKAHLNAYLASDGGKSFVHQQDIDQVRDLIRGVAPRLSNADLYKNSSPEDQAKLFTVVGKLYNQAPVYGNKLLNGIEQGELKNYDQISAEISSFVARDPKHPDKPTYLESGRDAAVAGSALFNALQNATERNPMRDPWQAVIGNPLIDPTTLRQDASQPHLPEQYATIKGTFVQPEEGRAFVIALEKGVSHNYGDPSSAHSRGFFAEGKDFAQWDRDGNGRAFVGGQWSDFSRGDMSLARNVDHTLDLHIVRNGETLNLLHITHPAIYANAVSHRATAHVHGEVLRQGMHGDGVQKLQAQLSELNYLNNTDTRDGKFGPVTKQAVKAFQHDHHLTEDGLAGAGTQQAFQASLQPLRQDRPAATSTVASTTNHTPGMDDPRHPANPNHALFNELKERFPDASENRLLQFTAACHVEDINERNLQRVVFDQERGLVGFGSGGLTRGTAIIDVKQPSPQPEQSIQQIQQYDQQQAINRVQFQAQQAQVNQQQAPTL
jgi:hypothetical protein